MDLDWTRPLVALALPQLAGPAGAFAARRAIGGWYRTLRKPPRTPPDRAGRITSGSVQGGPGTTALQAAASSLFGEVTR